MTSVCGQSTSLGNPMTTDYDPIAEQYQQSKHQPWRAFIERFTMMNLIGNLDGLSVLDLACGEGFYSRLVRQRGAKRVWELIFLTE